MRPAAEVGQPRRDQTPGCPATAPRGSAAGCRSTAAGSSLQLQLPGRPGEEPDVQMGEPVAPRFTWTRATPGSDRIARSSRTVITPSSAASRFGRSPRSRCDRDSRISTTGSPARPVQRPHPPPVAHPDVRLVAAHCTPGTPPGRRRPAAAPPPAGSSGRDPESPSKGNDGHETNSGSEGLSWGTGQTLAHGTDGTGVRRTGFHVKRPILGGRIAGSRPRRV